MPARRAAVPGVVGAGIRLPASRRWLAPMAMPGIALLWLALLSLLAPGLVQAQEGPWPGRVGRLVEVQGNVRLLDRAENEWIDASINRPVTGGDRLTSERGARAEVRIGSTTLRLDGASEIEFERLDDQAIQVRLHAGSLALKVSSQEVLGQLVVLTDEGRARPQQLGHYRIDRRAEATEATAWRGELLFEARDSRLSIAAGKRAELWLQGPGQVTHYTWRDVERDAFADWVAYDDHRGERSVTQQYVSPEMTGWEDLDRDGRWHTHPEYGGVWIPTAVPVGWAPYRMGHWAWIAPWGWTWVDQARWGFAPFHYGRWVWWNRRWCWTPGPRVHRPVFAPALVGWIGGPGVGVAVRVGGPPVAWVPLGPHDAYRPHAHWHDHGRWERRDRRHDDRRDGGRDDRRDDRRDGRHDHDRDGRDDRNDRGFGNQFVPGAVTVVGGDTFRHRRPVTPVREGALSVPPGTRFTAAEAPPAPPQPDAGRGRPAAPGRDDSGHERRGGGERPGRPPGAVHVMPHTLPGQPPGAQPGRRDDRHDHDRDGRGAAAGTSSGSMPATQPGSPGTTLTPAPRHDVPAVRRPGREGERERDPARQERDANWTARPDTDRSGRADEERGDRGERGDRSSGGRHDVGRAGRGESQDRAERMEGGERPMRHFGGSGGAEPRRGAEPGRPPAAMPSPAPAPAQVAPPPAARVVPPPPPPPPPPPAAAPAPSPAPAPAPRPAPRGRDDKEGEGKPRGTRQNSQ